MTGMLSRLDSNISSPELENNELYITKYIIVKTIIYSLTPIEYPPTSEEGVAIIYHIQEWNYKEAAFTDIQYSIGKSCGGNNTIYFYLGDVAITKKIEPVRENEMQCTGKLVLKCLRRHDETTSPVYFISCIRWKPNEKFHRYISLKENINIDLLCQLLNGLYEGIHSHPLPLPNHVPITIRSRLQELIHQADTNATDITPTQIMI
ncbi:711_t:CDS:2, partial [Funneliformis geosporum]